MAQIKEDIKRRDSIDFAKEDIGNIFRKMFIPTLLGMVSIVLLNIADGAFVGHGAGTLSLAAMNIAAPVFTLFVGIGMMFGIGTSVISSIHLSKGNIKAARINATQAIIGGFIATYIIGILIACNLPATCRLFGSSEELIPLASSYLKWISLCFPFCILGNICSFIIRLDGSPKYAMACSLIACILNIFLDWLFVYPLHRGLEGAAIATCISFSLSAIAALYYMFFRTQTLKLYKLRMTVKSLVLMLRNLWYQCKAGFSAMLGEVAISALMIIGNFIYIKYLGEDGVAAYGVVCYCMPIIFMLSNAIVQSIQPILSFAYGNGNKERLTKATTLAMRMAVYAGLFSTIILTLGSPWVTAIFLDSDTNAYSICAQGLPYFGVAGLLITINMVLVGYLQSVKRSVTATIYTLLRGFILIVPSFILMPKIAGVLGIWLSIPVSEAITLIVMLSIIFSKKNGENC